MKRRSLLAAPLVLLAPRLARATPEPATSPALNAVLDRAASLAPLRTVHVAQGGETVAARAYNGARLEAPANIKSASKSIISALVGIAIDRGVLESVDQTIAPMLAGDLPTDPDPRLGEITIGHLLSMQAGLERTSGGNYGRWVSSRNWVRAALDRPFVTDPGGSMLYSTGSTHLLSAILTRRAGRSTLDLARDWLGPVEGFAITAWTRDPQGIPIGGNEMAMRPSSLLAFGELYRRGGRTAGGRRILPPAWVEASWVPRTASRFTGDAYGYGWFLRVIAGTPVRYAWGYGGQMLYVAPDRGVTIAMTSATDVPAGRTGHRDALHRLSGDILAALA
ncbi:serine hydrolase domain-containing protein [Ancylobacter terrae]|uniref:serine hydrolase domain-containing protein n=1 Tax=Ancylobacter sp. sgz301288 TaxID=3342077 RepID=UPI00385FAD36